MGLATERVFCAGECGAKSRRVCGMLEGVEDSTSFAIGEVELTRSIHSNVKCDDTSHFLTEGLCGDFCNVRKVS
jgi:hypothetical protein